MPIPTMPSSSAGDQEYVPGGRSRARDQARDHAREPRPDAFDPDPSYPEQAPPTLVLGVQGSPPPAFGSLSWLSHLLGLDLYEQTTLSYAARTDMNFAGLILAIIFVFDTFAWGLLIYFLVNAGSMELRWSRVIFALGGLLPACALLIYERGFMTTDLSAVHKGAWRPWLALVLRCGIIGVGAFITAQPVELMAFADRINRRIHEERVREAVVLRAADLQRHVAARNKVDGGESQVRLSAEALKELKAKIAALETRLAEATARHAAAETAVIDAQRLRSDAYVTLGAARRALKKATDEGQPLDGFERTVSAAASRAGSAESTYRARVSERTLAKTEVDTLTAELASARESLTGTQQRVVDSEEAVAAAARVEALKNWVMTMRTLEPGAPYLDPFTKQPIVFPDYDFLDKLRIIDELRAGLPPRWPNADPALLKTVKTEYGLPDPDQRSSAADAWNTTRTYWAVFLFALVVPFTSLLFKLIMPAHLSLYYSRRWQATQGNGHAVATDAWLDEEPERDARTRGGMDGRD